MYTEQINAYGGNLSHRIILINNDGQGTDITRLVTEFSIYESIFNTTMSADFVIIDSLGLIDGASPLTGQELITIEFISNNTTLLGAAPAMAFKVYKVDNKTELNPGTLVYSIHAASPELELNLTRYVDTPYKDLTGDRTVDAILKKYIIPKNSSKGVFYEPVDNVVTYTPVRHHPFDAIQVIGSESRSAENGDTSSYFFYETRQGFNFRTLSNLLQQSPQNDNVSPTGELSYFFSDPATESGKNLLERTIIGHTFLHNVDTLDSLTAGLYENDVVVVDTITKTFYETKFNYANNFNDLPHITGGGKPLINLSQDRLLGSNMGGSAHNRLVFGSLTVDGKSLGERITPTNDPDVFHGSERFTTVKNTVAQIASLKQHGIQVTVPVNLNIYAGDIVNIFIPTYMMRENDMTTSFIKHYGNSPGFLVTSISTTYTKNGDYISSMECVKESFATDLRGRPAFGAGTISKKITDLQRFITQSYSDVPFTSDKLIGVVTGTFSNIVQAKGKEIVKGLSEGTTLPDVSATGAVDAAATAAQDAVTSAAANAQAAVTAQVDKLTSAFSKEAIAGSVTEIGTQLVTSKLLSAFGVANFAKLVKIIKLLEKIPLFTSPITSIKSNISSVKSTVTDAAKSTISGGG
jgi:hypothetical protein